MDSFSSEYRDRRAVRDECGVRATLKNFRELDSINKTGIAFKASRRARPNVPGYMRDMVFEGPSISLSGIAPVVLGNELF